MGPGPRADARVEGEQQTRVDRGKQVTESLENEPENLGFVMWEMARSILKQIRGQLSPVGATEHIIL